MSSVGGVNTGVMGDSSLPQDDIHSNSARSRSDRAGSSSDSVPELPLDDLYLPGQRKGCGNFRIRGRRGARPGRLRRGTSWGGNDGGGLGGTSGTGGLGGVILGGQLLVLVLEGWVVVLGGWVVVLEDSGGSGGLCSGTGEMGGGTGGLGGGYAGGWVLLLVLEGWVVVLKGWMAVLGV